MNSETYLRQDPHITRREAIKRTAMLLGVAVSSSTIAGCMGEKAQAPTIDWKPQFLNDAQAGIVNAAAERILPRTDTLGAQDVGVPQFIDLLYGKYMDSEERLLFVSGLSKLDSKKFSSLSEEKQDGALKDLATSSNPRDKAFFAKIREVTLLGYFTSKEVGTTVTHYDPIPGAYVGCVPISETGNTAWTDQ